MLLGYFLFSDHLRPLCQPATTRRLYIIQYFFVIGKVAGVGTIIWVAAVLLSAAASRSQVGRCPSRYSFAAREECRQQVPVSIHGLVSNIYKVSYTIKVSFVNKVPHRLGCRVRRCCSQCELYMDACRSTILSPFVSLGCLSVAAFRWVDC